MGSRNRRPAYRAHGQPRAGGSVRRPGRRKAGQWPAGRSGSDTAGVDGPAAARRNDRPKPDPRMRTALALIVGLALAPVAGQAQTEQSLAETAVAQLQSAAFL